MLKKKKKKGPELFSCRFKLRVKDTKYGSFALNEFREEEKKTKKKKKKKQEKKKKKKKKKKIEDDENDDDPGTQGFAPNPWYKKSFTYEKGK